MRDQVYYRVPTQAEIEENILRARRMRSKYLAKSVKAGLSGLRGAFMHKKSVRNVTA